ncbi:MAG TPA: lysylphosphatidylglycerol synthase transmembrane domain-containing protein [Vicinamibacterales bacterium]|nr:lysylphosphatidylglycerol synthase transmembrane domain-containing protein [Vicinamibacterales bacterium]
MATEPSASRLPWRTLFIGILTIGLLWLFVSSIDLREVGRHIRQARPLYIIAAVVVTMLTYGVRATRWRVLLTPIGRARYRTAFRTTVIGFAATFLLPGRVGEVLRPFLLARTEGLNATSTFATIIVERLLDMCTVLLLFDVAIAASGLDVGPEVRAAGIVAAVVSVAGLAALFVFAGHPERLGRWTMRLAARLPARFAEKAGRFVQTFAEGLKILRSPGHLALAIAWSLPLWISIALGIWLTSRAFDLTFSFVGSFLVMGYLLVGVSLPTPGGAGGFHTLYLLALTRIFGADPDVAGAAAIVLHAVSFVPVTLLGLVFMWQDGLTFGNLKGLRAEARAETS